MTKTNDFRVVVMMAALALAVSAAALVLVGPPASAANTLVVDDDKVECGKATFTSIQDAVDAAGQGDLIRVCPGQYHESVIVDKPLTLAAEDRDALDALDCFDRSCCGNAGSDATHDRRPCWQRLLRGIQA